MGTRRVVVALSNRQRRLLVIVDATSCTAGLADLPDGTGISVVDAVEFVDANVVDRLSVFRHLDKIVIHPTGSTAKLGTDETIQRLAHQVSDGVVVPPTLDAADSPAIAVYSTRNSAHRRQPQKLRQSPKIAASVHVSTNRTCELAMTNATSADYRHLLEVLDEITTRLDYCGPKYDPIRNVADVARLVDWLPSAYYCSPT